LASREPLIIPIFKLIEPGHHRWIGDKLFLDCSIQPKSNEDKIVGLVAGLIKIRLSAAPTDGKANKLLIKYLSRQFDVKQSAITIVNGHTSRKKKLRIESPKTIPDILSIDPKP
jgi:uncharacterized protein (TIGR00251 family)